MCFYSRDPLPFTVVTSEQEGSVSLERVGAPEAEMQHCSLTLYPYPRCPDVPVTVRETG